MKVATDSVGCSMGGLVPALQGMPRHNSDGIGLPHARGFSAAGGDFRECSPNCC